MKTQDGLKDNRGGARAGAGRKAKEATLTVTYRVSEAAVIACRKKYGRTLNAMVNEQMKEWAKDWPEIQN